MRAFALAFFSHQTGELRGTPGGLGRRFRGILQSSVHKHTPIDASQCPLPPPDSRGTGGQSQEPRGTAAKRGMIEEDRENGTNPKWMALCGSELRVPSAECHHSTGWPHHCKVNVNGGNLAQPCGRPSISNKKDALLHLMGFGRATLLGKSCAANCRWVWYWKSGPRMRQKCLTLDQPAYKKLNFALTKSLT